VQAILQWTAGDALRLYCLITSNKYTPKFNLLFILCSGKPEDKGGWGHYQNKGLQYKSWSKPDFGNAVILGLYGVWKWMQKSNRCFMFYCKVCHEIRTHTCEAKDIMMCYNMPFTHTMKFLRGFFIHEKSQSLHQLSNQSWVYELGLERKLSKGYVTNGAILQYIDNLIYPDLYPFHPCWLVNSVLEEEERNCERDLSTER